MKNLDLPKETVRIQVELERKPTRMYLERIDESHCNPYQMWLDMGSPQDLTPADVEAIKERTAMVQEELECKYHNSLV